MKNFKYNAAIFRIITFYNYFCTYIITIDTYLNYSAFCIFMNTIPHILKCYVAQFNFDAYEYSAFLNNFTVRKDICDKI